MAEALVGRRLFLMRHGERVDRVFGSKDGVTWVDRCFMPDCNYKRQDGNMPRECPLRSRDASQSYDLTDYNFDPPLTAIGGASAEQLGFHVSFTRWNFTTVYSSPSLRCLQTVSRFVKGLRDGKMKIDHLLPLKIEPGAFDFCGFNEYQFSGIPTFMNNECLEQRNINISTKYLPMITADKLNTKEDITTFYARVGNTIKHILDQNCPKADAPSPSILISTHAPFMDTAVQILLKQPARTSEYMKTVANYVRYVGTLTLEEDPKEEEKWKLITPPVQTFRYRANNKFEWKTLTKTTSDGSPQLESW